MYCGDLHRLKYSTLPLVYDDSLSYLEMIARLSARVDHIFDELLDAGEVQFVYNQDTLNLDMVFGVKEEYYEHRNIPYYYCH